METIAVSFTMLAVLLRVIEAEVVEAEAECPTDWSNYFTTTDKCIRAYADQKTWIEAMAFCSHQTTDGTGTLATVHNAFQNMDIATVAQLVGATDHVWLGLNDIDEDGKYVWTDGTDLDYLNWVNAPQQIAGTAAYLGMENRNRWTAASAYTERCSFVCMITGVRPTSTAKQDCLDLYVNYGVRKTGDYQLDNYVNVWCDMESDGGGWTTLMRRVNGKENFNARALQEYYHFFGDVSSSHWQGLEEMAQLAGAGGSSLLVEARGIRTPGQTDESYYAYDIYTGFEIYGASENYRVKVSSPKTSGNLTGVLDFGQSANNGAFALHNSPAYSHGGWWLAEDKLETDTVAFYLNGDYAQYGDRGMYVYQGFGGTGGIPVNPIEVSMKVRRTV